MEEQVQSQIESILGYWVYILISGIAFLLFRSSIESIAESIKVFWGKDLNTDDVVILDGRPARVVRVGIWKTTFFVYEVGSANGKPYVKSGNKLQIQNTEIKHHTIEKPLPMLDVSKWEEKSDK